MKYLFSIIFVLLVNSVCYGIDAFPSAKGLGKNTVGGRDGSIIHVTNLNANGAGSFRAALETSGARTIVFDVSGTINQDDALLNVTNPYLTIAGQTSPGGIEVVGHQTSIATHDVIIRHMRFRAGSHTYDTDGVNPDTDGDALDLLGKRWNDAAQNVYNIIIDHVSFGYGTDETVSITGGSTATTIQNCLIGPSLEYAKSATTRHGKGMLVSGKYNENTAVSLYRNFHALCGDRNPQMYQPPDTHESQTVSGKTYYIEGINNVAYNWYHGFRPDVGGAAKVNWINNYSKEGPESNRANFFLQYINALVTPTPLVYVSGNKGAQVDGTEITFTGSGVSDSYSSTLEVNSGFIASAPWGMDVNLPQAPMTDVLAAEIVAVAGATIPTRDTLDVILAGYFTDGEGATTSDFSSIVGWLVRDVSYPDDYPTYSTSNDNPTDTDSDGMPDTWETANGTSITVANNNSHTFDDDYTDIEYYINKLAGDYGSGSPLNGNSQFTIGGNSTITFK